MMRVLYANVKELVYSKSNRDPLKGLGLERGIA